MVGGGTEFANTYAAYENLLDEDRKRYDDLRVVHTFEAAQRLVKPDPDERELAAWRGLPPREMSLRGGAATAAARWPSARRPTTSSAWTLTRAGPSSTGCSPGPPRNGSGSTHEWQVGDLVMWDNTGMLHRALPYDASSQRTLHRTTIVGDEAWA
ncbi:TauD/TfdA dioxygenase family protein [Yinghuangia aomiensis]